MYDKEPTIYVWQRRADIWWLKAYLILFMSEAFEAPRKVSFYPVGVELDVVGGRRKPENEMPHTIWRKSIIITLPICR